MKTIDDIANILSSNVDKNKSSCLIVSGGKSPLKTYKKLSKCDIDWAKINIILCDDRDVSRESDLSNEKHILTNLIINKASKANYISLRGDPRNALKYINQFDIGIFGFGYDGHFASIFSDHIKKRNFISKDAIPDILFTDNIGEPFCKRITMNLSMILECKNILILDVPEKRHIFQEAKDNNKMPLHHLLQSSHKSISILSP